MITDVRKDKKVYIATKDGTVVGGLQHPVYIAKDWNVYLLAATAEENERNQRIREELERRTEPYKPEVESFLAHYRGEGCGIHTGLANDWMTFILLNGDLYNLPRIKGLRIRSLG